MLDMDVISDVLPSNTQYQPLAGGGFKVTKVKRASFNDIRRAIHASSYYIKFNKSDITFLPEIDDPISVPTNVTLKEIERILGAEEYEVIENESVKEHRLRNCVTDSYILSYILSIETVLCIILGNGDITVMEVKPSNSSRSIYRRMRASKVRRSNKL